MHLDQQRFIGKHKVERKGDGLEINYIVETTSHKLYYSDNIA